MSHLRITKSTADMEVCINVTPKELQDCIKKLDPLTLVQICHATIKSFNKEVITELQEFFGDHFQNSSFVEEVEDFYQRVTKQ